MKNNKAPILSYILYILFKSNYGCRYFNL